MGILFFSSNDMLSIMHFPIRQESLRDCIIALHVVYQNWASVEKGPVSKQPQSKTGPVGNERGYYCNQCLPQREKVKVEANLAESTSVVQEYTEFEIDLEHEGANIKVILSYPAATKVG